MAWMNAPERLVGGTFIGLGCVAGLALPAVWLHSGPAAGALMLAGGVLYTARTYAPVSTPPWHRGSYKRRMRGSWPSQTISRPDITRARERRAVIDMPSPQWA